MKILLVDDEPHVINVLSIFLKKDNYTILSANNGDQAMELINKEKPDFIVTDIQMPKMNGQMLCDNINENDELSSIQIIVMTSRTDEDLRVWAKQYDNITFMEKPLSPRKLVYTLRKLSTRESIIKTAI